MRQRVVYERSPEGICRRSRAVIEVEADLDSLPSGLRPVARRMIQACGMVDLPTYLRYDERIGASIHAALRLGKPILVDSKMLAAGVMRRYLPRNVRLLCMLDDPRVTTLARENHITRSAAAVSLWREVLSGSIVLIGCAPTALFALLELIDETRVLPAALIATPVGFVGAVESKERLSVDPRGVPFLTLLGRRGGSAIAASAFNAIAGGES